MTERILSAWLWEPLNESPSEKEGKLPPEPEVSENTMIPSMKVPPKRKGNGRIRGTFKSAKNRLNESPSEKEGK